MTDYPFGNSDESPKYLYDGSGRFFFFSPALQERDGRVELFQGHHLIPNNLFTNTEFDMFWSELVARGYSQSDADWNQAWLPTQDEDVLRLGAAKHNGSHDAYDAFIRAKLTEISEHAKWYTQQEFARLKAADPSLTDAAAQLAANKLAYDQAFNDVRGLQQWAKWALQAVDEFGRPLLATNDSDPRLGNLSAADLSKAAIEKFTIYSKSGTEFIDGSLQSDTYFLKGYVGTPLGGYGHSLDFDDQVAYWDVDTRADIMARDVIVTKIAGSGLDHAEFERIVQTSEFQSLRAGIKSAMLRLPDSDIETVHSIKALGDKLLWADPVEFIGWQTQTMQLLSSSSIDFFADMDSQLKTGPALAVWEMAKRFVVDQSGAVSIDGLAGLDAATALKIGAAVSAMSFGVLKTHIAHQKYGGFTDQFWEWAEAEAAGLAIGVPLAAGAVYLLSGSPAGVALLIGLGAAGAYVEIKEIAQDIAEIYPGTSAATAAATILGAMQQFEAALGDYAGIAASFAGELLPSVQYVDGDRAALVLEKNQWLIGADRALLIGSDENDVLIHFGSGEVLGGAGDDKIVSIGADYNGPNDKLELDGGEGNDVIISFGGPVFQYGGAGDDWLLLFGSGEAMGGDGDDVIFKIGADEETGAMRNLNGGGGADTLSYIYAKYATGLFNIGIEPDSSGDYDWRLKAWTTSPERADLAYDIKQLIGTAGQDRLLMPEALPEGLDLRIDGFGSGGEQDIFDGSQFSGGASFKTDASGRVMSIEDDVYLATGLRLTGDWQFLGGAGADYVVTEADRPAVLKQIEQATGLLPELPSDSSQMFSGYAPYEFTLGGFTTIDTGAGNDVVDARHSIGVEIELGAGNDLVRGGLGSVIYTGEGEDTVWWTPGAIAMDAGAHDRVSFFGYEMELAIAMGGSESEWAYGASGLVQVGFNPAGEMVIGTPFWRASADSPGGEAASYLYLAAANRDPMASSSQLTAGIRVAALEIAAYQIMQMPDGISLADNLPFWEFVSLVLKDFFSEARVAGVDPLALDLDGDGIELTPGGYGPLFDLDGDFFLEPSGWVRSDDGFLALDSNGNGIIDDIGELFGGAGASGFAALSALDSNADGVIDVNDAQFAELKVWRDLDQDGQTDSGELAGLAGHGIASISLAATENGTKISGNIVARTGSFTRTDGTTGTVADLELRLNNFDSVYRGNVDIDPVIVGARPNLKGHGTLTDLHVALTLEGGGGQLATTIDQVLPTLDVIDLDQLRERAFPILTAWSQVAQGSQQIGGNPDVPVLVSRTSNGVTVHDFAVEVTETVMNSDGTSAILRDQVHYYVLGSPPNQIEEIRFSDGTVWTSADLRFRYLLEATTIGNDVIRGFYSNDVLDGGAGDDRLEGGDGSDAYVFLRK